jgi:hypothetical protein
MIKNTLNFISEPILEHLIFFTFLQLLHTEHKKYQKL